MTPLENPLTGPQTSRRNLARIGAIAASAIIAKTTPAEAGPFSWLVDLFGGGRHRGRQRDSHCFLKGTTIRTADGDRKIEDLAVGDLLPTHFGGMRSAQWIGYTRFNRSY